MGTDLLKSGTKVLRIRQRRPYPLPDSLQTVSYKDLSTVEIVPGMRYGRRVGRALVQAILHCAEVQ